MQNETNNMSSNENLIDQYLVWLSDNKGRAETTVEKYRGYLLRLEEWTKHRPLLELERETLETFAGPVAVKLGLAGNSRRALVAAVRGFYAWALNYGHTQSNPAANTPYPKSAQRMPVPFSLHHAERLIWKPDLGTFIGWRDATIFAVLIGCGLRVSGLTNLNEGDIQQTRVDNETRLSLRIKEKGDKQRLVPVPREAQMLLQGYLGQAILSDPAIDRRLPNGDQVLFITLNNRNINPSDYYGEARRVKPKGIWQSLKRYGQKIGIPDEQLHPHAFRHLYGTELAEADVDLITRAALLGQVDVKSTEIYTHLAMRKLLDIADQANPLGKMRTPVSELLKAMESGQ